MPEVIKTYDNKSNKDKKRKNSSDKKGRDFIWGFF